jgi:hypothetical protein
VHNELTITNTLRYLHWWIHQRLAEAIKQNILMKDLILNTIIFADDQVTAACTEDELQGELHAVNNAATENIHNLKISININRRWLSVDLTPKLLINNQTTEETNSLNYFIHISMYLPTYLTTHLSIHLSIYLSIYLPTYLPTKQPNKPSINPTN